MNEKEFNSADDDADSNMLCQSCFKKISSHSPKTWWFIEIWREQRETFKALAEHVIFFSMLFFLLILFDYLIKKSGLPEDKKLILEKIDFYCIVICIGIFTVSFIYKLIIQSLLSGKKWLQISTSNHQMITL